MALNRDVPKALRINFISKWILYLESKIISNGGPVPLQTAAVKVSVPKL